MPNKIIEVNEKTLHKFTEMMPDTKSPMKLISFIMELTNNIKLTVNNELEDGEIRVKEGE